jgi:hypothetical protein
VPRELLAAPPWATLGVFTIRSSAPRIGERGFEHGLFKGVPGGFALVADGTSGRMLLPEQARWQKGSPVFDFIDFLGDLFFEKPGYFRVIVFAVTTETQINGSRCAPSGTARGHNIPQDLAQVFKIRR